MKRLSHLWSLSLFLFAACSATPPLAPTPPAAQAAESPSATVEKPAKLPKLPLTHERMTTLLLAEIAAGRGQWAEAAHYYHRLAEDTRDPRIAQRAAEVALFARRPDLALANARLAYALEPQAPHLRLLLIRLLAAHERYDELEPLLADLLAAEAGEIEQNLAHLPRLFPRSQDRRAVKALIERVTRPYEDRAEAHFARAVAAYDARELSAARAAIQRARALKPDWEAAALLQVQLTEDREEALRLLGDFVKATPTARQARLAYARALTNEKRYAEARAEFKALLDQGAADPAKNGDIIFAVAVLSLQLGEPKVAEPYLRQLVAIRHSEADKARLFLGQIAEDDKRYDEAIQWFAEIGAGEHYLPAQLRIAAVLAKQGRLSDARAHLHRVRPATPREAAQLVIGEAQLLREAEQLTDAYRVLTDGLAQYPDQPELLYETALIAERLGRYDELERRLRRLLEIQPDHAHALNALGYSLADRNIRLQEARAMIERALELAPNDPFILDSHGWVLYRLGEIQQAYEILARAFEARADPEIAAHLGEVLWQLGRREEARAIWEKAQREHPKNEVLSETIKRFLP
ncbi:MAG: tetratricopeptide repeat protein [Rhodocyclaceae bacterium]|nr:tetratricopeptide repeat protein [Rhodocyclaceae bacterium]